MEKIEKRKVDTHIYMAEIKKLLEQGHAVPLIVTGNSMSPFLMNERDRVLIQKAAGELKRGDIVFYQRWTGQYVMHRIHHVDKEGRYYIVGDAQQQIEGPIRRQQIFGFISSVYRKGKWIRKGDLWWDFFEKVWIRIVPFRNIIRAIVFQILKK